jgi:NADH-quinone oxidoreductase subunit M
VTFFVITSLALVGLPILNGFVGEFLVLSAAFATHVAWGAVATLGVILSAAYMLTAIQKVFYGNQSAMVQGRVGVPDIQAREHLILWPFMTLLLLMGIASPYWIKAIEPAIAGFAHPVALDNSTTPAVASDHVHQQHEQRAEAQ